jgi:hypothetical protein
VKTSALFLLVALCSFGCTDRQHDFQAALDGVEERCGLGPWRLRANSGMLASIEVPPNVRALPLTEGQIACVNAELKKIPEARLVALD